MSNTRPFMFSEIGKHKSKSIAGKGLKEGLRDDLTMVIQLPTDQKEILNDQLLSKGLRSLNLLVSTIKETANQVLRRGKIKNLDEYYVIKEVLSDMAYDISDTDRNSLEKIFCDFEDNYRKKKNAS